MRTRARIMTAACLLGVLATHVACLPESTVVGPAPERLRDIDPDRLMGMSGPGLLSFIGAPPSLRRIDGPAQIWQYSTGDCVFDVFLYQDGSDVRVNYFEARHPGRRDVEPPACLSDVVLSARVSG